VIFPSFKYAMLMCSLPVHPSKLFSNQQTAISGIQLDKRLALLDAQDAKDLLCIEELLFWSQISDATDEFIIKKSLEIIDSIHDGFLRNVLTWRLELRTLLCALRLRCAGLGQPPKNSFVGIGRWLSYIESNWDKPDFGLGFRAPWLNTANQLLIENRSFELEKLLMEITWKYYATESNQHFFDFPAVVIYVLRWDIINRWTLYHADLAVKHFDELVENGLDTVTLEF